MTSVIVVTGAEATARATRRRLGADEQICQFYDSYAILAESSARVVAFAIGQPDEVDINEILFRPTAQEL